MSELSPRSASSMAREVYAVQTKTMLRAFLTRKEFSTKSSEKQAVDATVGSRLVNTRDGFAVCAKGGQGYENDLFLVFRGSTTANMYADWISNFRIGVEPGLTGSMVHLGFNHIFTSMQPQIQEFLERNGRSARTVHCVGHSLGGAVATLAADWVRGRSERVVKLYTFGAPKPGFGSFSDRLTQRLGRQNIYRVYHTTDPVPMVPLYPFMHPPADSWGYHLPSSDSLLSAEAHDIKRYVHSVGASGWKALDGPAPLTATDKLVERWLMSEQSVNPFSPKTWDWLNAALILVVKKILKGAAMLIQGGITIGITLADKVAWLLRKGIDLSKAVGEWVHRLILKIMQALGMVASRTVEELTQGFMRQVLQRLMERIGAEAARAVRQIVS